MGKYDEIKKEIKELISDGTKEYEGLCLYAKTYINESIEFSNPEEEKINTFLVNYETWYSSSLRLIKTFLPERVNDFTILYRDEKRKEITSENYTVSDALQGKNTLLNDYYPGNAPKKFFQQIAILKACLDCFDKKIYDIQVVLQADVFDSEIDSARHLFKMGYLRAAGAICGVVIENHLCSVCNFRNITLRKKNPSIGDYNEALKDVAYDTIEWRRIQRLRDLRNLCDPKKDREPTKDEVEELILGTDRVIKNIF